MKIRAIAGLMAGAAVLSGCGGGGGGGDDARPGGQGGTTAQAAPVSGVASKGLLKNAIVTAYAISGGAPDFGKPLASTRTGSTDGRYSLTIPAAADPYYVIEISVDAATRHADETTGEQTPPPGFKLHALVQPANGGAVTAHVTPFSDMAYAAAAGAGLSAANIQKAQSNLRQLLGFDPQSVAPHAIPSLGSESPQEERTLAAALTAVSQIAKDGGLGCNTGTPADKTQCVVRKLSASYSLASTLPAAAEKAALLSALDKVADNPDYSQASGAADAIAGAIGSASGTPLPGAGNQTAIAAAKSLFNDLLSVGRTLLLPGSSGSSPVAAEVQRFRDGVETGVRPTTDSVLSDAAILVIGADLYDDFKAGRSATSSVQRGVLGVRDWFGAPGASCYVAGTDGSPAATAAAAVNARCHVRQASLMTPVGVSYPDAELDAHGATITREVHQFLMQEWYHDFVIVPGGGRYGYTAQLKQRNRNCAQTYTTRTPPGGAGVTDDVWKCDPPSSSAAIGLSQAGTVGVTETSVAGRAVQSFDIAGDLPLGTTRDGEPVAGDKSTWQLSGSLRTEAGRRRIELDGFYSTLEGSRALVSAEISGAHAEGLAADGASGIEADAASEVEITGIWTLGSSQLVGTLRADRFVREKVTAGVGDFLPTRVLFSGSASNLPASGGRTEFAAGWLQDQLSHFAEFDAAAPSSPSNYLDHELGFVGQVTATGKPKLALSLSARSRQDGRSEPSGTFSGQLGMLSATGTPVRAVNFNAGTFGPGGWTATLADAGSGVSLAVGSTLRGKQPLKDDKGAEIGKIDYDKLMVTFTNGEFMSLR